MKTSDFQLTPFLFITIWSDYGKILKTELKAGTSTIKSNISDLDELEKTLLLFAEKYQQHNWLAIDNLYFAFPENLRKFIPLYTILKNSIASGETISYSKLGALCSIHPRVVGIAMAKNIFPGIIPCHRVVAKNGGLCGFSAEGGIITKEKLLLWENQNVKTTI